MNRTFDRRELLKLSGAGALCAALSGCVLSGRRAPDAGTRGSARRSNRPPNILFLFTDDQRHDAANALGDAAIKTPNIDRLVRQGVSFTNTYIMGSCHGAVCMPSRAMLLTGRHYFNLPDSVTQAWKVAPERRGECAYPTFPEVFRAAGYDTFGTGKWHNGRALFAKCFTRGGAIFFGGMADHSKTPIFDFDPTGTYVAENQRVGTGFSSELFSDAAVEYLENRTDDKPFLMYVSYTAPHDPRMAPQAYADMYPPEQVDLPPNFMLEHPFPIGVLRIRDEKLGPYPRQADDVRKHIAGYYAMITHLDAQIGRILDTLEQTGQAGNTVIILASDNGLAVGQHGLLGKQSVYEHSAKVPLVICGPSLPRGCQHDALCYLHDLFPTLCDLAGLPIPASVQTRSLQPLWDGTTDNARESIYLSYGEPEANGQPLDVFRGVRCGRWKLIKTAYRDHRQTQLFDLVADPWELNNLAREPGHADRVSRLSSLMRAWIKQSGDPLNPDVIERDTRWRTTRDQCI